MERAIQGAREAMSEAVLNPEFQAALDEYEPFVEPSEAVEQRVELQDAALVLDQEHDDEAIDLDFSALVDEEEGEASTETAPPPRRDADSEAVAQPVINPFALLVNPAAAYAAAKRLESAGLPRRTLFLFGKKGPAAS